MRLVVTLSLVLLPVAGCGPAVEEPGAGDSATDGASVGSTSQETTNVSDSVESTAVDGSSTDPGDDTGPLLGVCGDGQLDPGESCDDGNADNADGCSANCTSSGTIMWTNPLPGGFGVGLDVRDGRAVAAVQQFEMFEGIVALRGYDREGNLAGEFMDVGGFSDRYFARAPIALLPDGTVAAGYPVFNEDDPNSNRKFGVVSLESGVVWSHADDSPRWENYFGTTWNSAGLFVLHASPTDDGDVLVVERFEETGEHIGTTSLGSSVAGNFPFARGALPARPLPLVSALTVTPEGSIDLWTQLLSRASFERYPIGTAEVQTGPAAFSDGLFTHVWTGKELIMIDELEHIGTTTAHDFEGELLWADVHGLVVFVNDTLVVYDAAGQERFTAPLPVDPAEERVLRPSYIRPDGDAGLFVVADVGVPPDMTPYSVVMHYIVR